VTSVNYRSITPSDAKKYTFLISFTFS